MRRSPEYDHLAQVQVGDRVYYYQRDGEPVLAKVVAVIEAGQTPDTTPREGITLEYYRNPSRGKLTPRSRRSVVVEPPRKNHANASLHWYWPRPALVEPYRRGAVVE